MQKDRLIPAFSSRQAKQWLYAVLILFSLVYTAYSWSHFSDIKERLAAIPAFGGALVLTEVSFIAGALLMAAAIGESFEGISGRKHLWAKAMYARKHTKRLAEQFLESRLFGLGFWLNFIGAVGTTAILAVGVVTVLPVGSWALLLVLLVDLLATFSWRIPLQMTRSGIGRRRHIQVRSATREDIDVYLALQRERWYDDATATKEQLLSRFAVYPQGMMVAQQHGKAVGMVYVMKIPSYDYDNSLSWDQITHNGMCDNHDPDGTVIFGVDLSTAKGVGGLAGDRLLVGVAQLAIRENIEYAMLGGRMPGYHNYADKMTAEEYLWAKTKDGRFLDPQVQYYASVAGLRVVKALPDYFDDPGSCDYGVLLRWKNPFYNKPAQWLWPSLFPALFALEEAYIAITKRLKKPASTI
jgi:hypothetical protein